LKKKRGKIDAFERDIFDFPTWTMPFFEKKFKHGTRVCV